MEFTTEIPNELYNSGMTNLRSIPIDAFIEAPLDFWDAKWLLLTSGEFSTGHYNAMTVSWGSLGVMWNRPFAQVVVRPQRYTFQFMEKYSTFTLCLLKPEFHPALDLLGTQSGRDSNKIAEAGLTPIAACVVAAPIYTQAAIALECRKVYWQDLDPNHFLNPSIQRHYPEKDYHRIYYGEVVAVTSPED